ncbi:MAG: hypothetical protein K6348_09290, partial [Deferribacterales bacterium]
LSIYYKDFEEALYVLNLLYKEEKNIKYLEKEAEIYAYLNKSQESSNIYLTLFNSTEDRISKREYFIKAINSLIWGKKYKEAVSLAKKYEDYFLNANDVTTLKFLLKVYLQAGDLDSAHNLSSKILKGII